MNWKKVLIGLISAAIIFFGAVAVSCKVAPPDGVPIIQYHMINDTDKSEYNVPTAEFEVQMQYLQSEGYTPISLLEFAKAKKGKFDLPAKPIIITFDDGYRDNYVNALPIMEKYGMKATLFMVVNDIGRNTYMTMEDLQGWVGSGMELGSHTANHPELPKLDRLKKQEELQASKLLMEWRGLPTVFFLAYPYGEYDKETEELLAKNDYLGGLTGKVGLNTFTTNMYEMHRINIPNPHFGITEFKWRLLKADIWARLGAN